MPNQYICAKWSDADYLAYWRSKCVTDSNGCWVWQGSKNWKGYGQVLFRGVRWVIHRFMYAAYIGPIPPGMFVCHTCDNPPCCNPDHLWLGTHADNQKDMVRKGRHAKQDPICKRGHPFTPENTQVTTDRDGRVHRRCITCRKAYKRTSPSWSKERFRLWRAQKKAAKLSSST